MNCIDGVMISVLASSAVDREFNPRSEGQTKYYKFIAPLISTHHLGGRAKTGWLGIRINKMCPSGATCLFADCGINDLALYTSNSTICSSAKRTSSSFSSHYILSLI